MRSVEEFVAPGSDYYIHAPSRQAESMLLFPLQAGHFIYAPGYTLRRESFDSFLLMYIQKGSLTLTFEGRTRHVSSGSFILIDCCKLHAYAAQDGCECLWCHFDGVTARGLYNAVTSRLGCVFTLAGELPPLRKLQMIYDAFKGGGPVREPSMHKYLTDIMTSFLLAPPCRRGHGSRADRGGDHRLYCGAFFRGYPGGGSGRPRQYESLLFHPGLQTRNRLHAS